nr:PilZ domain-containing protein [Granulicella sp. dw_53]
MRITTRYDKLLLIDQQSGWPPPVGRKRGRVARQQKPDGENPVRTAVRFPMKLALRVHSAQGELDAVTENISANGLLFVGEILPAVNSRIEFTIAMPSSVMGSQRDVTIHCVGRVVRHQMHGDTKQAAAVIDEYFLKA